MPFAGCPCPPRRGRGGTGGGGMLPGLAERLGSGREAKFRNGTDGGATRGQGGKRRGRCGDSGPPPPVHSSPVVLSSPLQGMTKTSERRDSQQVGLTSVTLEYRHSLSRLSLSPSLPVTNWRRWRWQHDKRLPTTNYTSRKSKLE